MTRDRSEPDLSEPSDPDSTPTANVEGLTPDAASEDAAVTGILLVGGASERFGSPKALAQFQGKTLAERAWRVLGEACEERIAVGKATDALELPFAVLDDGSRERAPIYGVVAGLRAATNDLCVVLPVDCPLVTPSVLCALAAARAVPQTGPLPGAYERAHVPELEARLERGELSLRGVNPNVLELPEDLHVTVNTPADLRRVERQDSEAATPRRPE